MYNAFGQSNSILEWANMKVASTDTKKYPLYWLNSFLLNPIIEKKSIYEISCFKPDMARLIITIMISL